MIVLLFGESLGWLSATVLVSAVVAIILFSAFVRVERNRDEAFIDFALFKNKTFTGATVSNFLMNSTIGILMVSQQLIQLAGCRGERSAAGVCQPGDYYTAWDAGLLTLGYGITIVLFIRVGEKLLQHFGPRKPMIWGALITGIACILLMMTHVLIGQYVILAVIAYIFFGLDPAFSRGKFDNAVSVDGVA